MLPWLVAMLTLTWAGSVGTLPVRGGGVAGLLAGSAAAGYWQFAPRSAGAVERRQLALAPLAGWTASQATTFAGVLRCRCGGARPTCCW